MNENTECISGFGKEVGREAKVKKTVFKSCHQNAGTNNTIIIASTFFFRNCDKVPTLVNHNNKSKLYSERNYEQIKFG
jgi:hypothetical protein